MNEMVCTHNIHIHSCIEQAAMGKNVFGITCPIFGVEATYIFIEVPPLVALQCVTINMMYCVWWKKKEKDRVQYLKYTFSQQGTYYMVKFSACTYIQLILKILQKKGFLPAAHDLCL